MNKDVIMNEVMLLTLLHSRLPAWHACGLLSSTTLDIPLISLYVDEVNQLLVHCHALFPF